jgi:hypothetical protein
MDPQGSLQKLLRRVGLDVHRYDPQKDGMLRRQRLLEQYDVRLVLDVGANAGQYARLLRRGGYEQPIVSFWRHAPPMIGPGRRSILHSATSTAPLRSISPGIR